MSGSSLLGSIRLPLTTKWCQYSSIEGSAAVFVAGAVAGFLALLVTDFPPATALPVALVAALAGAVVEAVSTHGLDNLTVQVAATAAAMLVIAV